MRVAAECGWVSMIVVGRRMWAGGASCLAVVVDERSWLNVVAVGRLSLIVVGGRMSAGELGCLAVVVDERSLLIVVVVVGRLMLIAV